MDCVAASFDLFVFIPAHESWEEGPPFSYSFATFQGAANLGLGGGYVPPRGARSHVAESGVPPMDVVQGLEVEDLRVKYAGSHGIPLRCTPPTGLLVCIPARVSAPLHPTPKDHFILQKEAHAA